MEFLLFPAVRQKWKRLSETRFPFNYVDCSPLSKLFREYQDEVIEGKQRPQMKLSDVFEARARLKLGSATGGSGLAAEMVMALGPVAMHGIWQLFSPQRGAASLEEVK